MDQDKREAAGNETQNTDANWRLNRRQALKLSAGVAGVLAGVASGAGRLLAQDGPGLYLPLVSATGTGSNQGSQQMRLFASGTGNDEEEIARRRAAVEAAFGNTTGTLIDYRVFKFSLPRTDITATIMGLPVAPDLALEGMVTIQAHAGREAMKFMLALLDEEVNPVLTALLASNLGTQLEIFSALHNHYLQDDPPIKFIHGLATGVAEEMAATLYDVLSNNSGTPFGHGEAPPGDPGFDWEAVAAVIGGTAELHNGVLTVAVPRNIQFVERGVVLAQEMMMSHEFKFQATGGTVLNLNEFVVLKDEAVGAARLLRERGFMVSALHNHELDIRPQAYHLHAAGTGDALALAQLLRELLDLAGGGTAVLP